jgi:hypothetical protein
LKIVSATRFAALNASFSGPVPKTRKMIIPLARFIRLLNKKATITVPAARAICRLAIFCVEVGESITPIIADF